MRTNDLLPLLAAAVLFAVHPGAALADGHGPAFALATPTLTQGQWSSDTAALSMSNDADSTVSFRELVGYGITQDLQASFAFPLAQGNTPATGTRAMQGMLGGGKDLEGSLLWRFQRKATGLGARRESSLLLSVWDGRGTDTEGLSAGQGIALGAVTGYASRSTYWWLGGGLQHYLPKGGGRLGDLYYVTAVWAWRPDYFRRDAPASDWRVLFEALGESTRKNELAGNADPNSGGHKLLAGPSLLGLYGAWGIEAGVLFPVSQSLNGNQPEDRYRAKAVFTYWF
ncbi:MAG TPA: hypothetical protein VF651_05985 [Gammaproteobacteria bacterium]